MATTVYSLLAFIVAISILVAVHEYGHYIVGRWTGMKVLRFSIGFGKPIWMHIGKGEDKTEYCISAIPLGGYVRFLDGREGPVDPQDEGRAFNHRPIPARIAVLLAGPLFNFLFAILIYWALFVYGEDVSRPAVGAVEPGSYAAEAGLERGDRILAVGDVETSDWEPALIAILDQVVSEGRVALRLVDAEGDERATTLVVTGDRTKLTEPGELFQGLGFEPWRPSAIIGTVADDGAANTVGIVAGDRVAAVDGKPVRNFYDLTTLVMPRPGEQVIVEIDRSGESLIFEVVLASTVDRAGNPIGLLGVTSADNPRDYYYTRKFGVRGAFDEAVARTWNACVFTVKMLGRMVTGKVSIKNISGPINIAQFAGITAQRGLPDYVAFLAIVSISLGIINLFPVPVLDGGQIVYQLVEGVKGSPLSERAQIAGQQVGILALILLMGFAFFNDIAGMLK
jgi:regulator of sigma E protease